MDVESRRGEDGSGPEKGEIGFGNTNSGKGSPTGGLSRSVRDGLEEQTKRKRVTFADEHPGPYSGETGVAGRNGSVRTHSSPDALGV